MDMLKIALYLCGLFASVKCRQVMRLEAENYWKSSIYRQSASQDKTVSLHENQVMALPFCLRRSTKVSVTAVHYTNDGPSNMIRISIDGIRIGQEESHDLSDSGKLWNVINSTGPIGEPVVLASGPHKLQIHIVPVANGTRQRDPWGIEIDSVFIDIDDNEISNHYLHCRNTMCSEKITYADRHRDRDDIPSGKLVQMSRPSTCLEEDNIKIAIYHESVKQFRISALPPRYRTFWTFKEAQFEGCPEYSHFHWQYMGVTCFPGAENRTHRNSRLSFRPLGPGAQTGAYGCSLVIGFDLEGISYGKTDAHIGDVLEVALDTIAEPDLVIKPRFGVLRNGHMVYDDVNPLSATGNNVYLTWSFPDYTWTEMNEDQRYVNEIILDLPNGTLVNFVRLKRRDEAPQQVTEIYDNQQIQIHKTEFDYWWRDPAIRSGQESNMSIYIDTVDGIIYKGFAHYIVVIEKRVWSPNGDMDQTFVLYQDGSARILPIVPHGLESYIPFGNDVVIGQADPSHMRPHAPIKKLVIHPVPHMIDIYYNDGGTATLQLFSQVEGTNVTLTNINFMKDKRTNPFAIFRSTWVEDGRAKVDHVTVNGLPAEHILLDRWTELFGTTFIFFRRCISAYNTQSPDYSLEILSDSEIKEV